MQYAIHQMTDTQKKHEEFKNRYPDLVEDTYRFNEEGELHNIDLADWRKLNQVEELAMEYVLSPQGRRDISSCAAKLVKTQGPHI
jgi:hypothetical protein